MSSSLPEGVQAATAATTSDSLELRLFLPSGATIVHLGSKVLSPGFTKPRMKQSFVGLPSITVSAAVAKDPVHVRADL